MFVLPIVSLLLTASQSSGFILGCSRSCDRDACPQSCISRVPDPCGCCPFLCAAAEGEACGSSIPCERDLLCRNTNNGQICSCEDDRMLCGSDSVTYASICQFNRDNRSGNLTIQHWGPCEIKPEIVSGPSDMRLRIGDPLALDCEAKGFPIPTITWTFTGRDGTRRQLPSDDELIAVQLRGGPEHLMVTSWVQIVESRPSDIGSYTCEAKNRLGSARAEASIYHSRA